MAQLNENERQMLHAARTKQPHRRTAIEAALGLSPGCKHMLPVFTPTAGVTDWKTYRDNFDKLDWGNAAPKEKEGAGDEGPEPAHS